MQFIIRLIILSCVLLLLAGIEYLKKREQAQRWREYLKLYACAACAAVFGACNDWYTVGISPDYFIYGKSLAPGPDLNMHAVLLGAQAGCVAGFILGACLLMYFKQLQWIQLRRAVVIILLTAVVCSQIGGVGWPLCLSFDDYFTAFQWNEQREHAFMRVWGMHIGLYVGALLGLFIVYILPRKTQVT